MHTRGGPQQRAGFFYNGKTLLSGIDPAGRADRVAEAVPVMDRTLYICPSPLYGFGLERLLARLAVAPNSGVLCIEADPELFALSREHFNTALKNNPKIRLTGCREAAALCSLLRQEWGPRSFRRVEMVRLSGGWQLFPALYDSLADSLRREIALDWGNAMTLTKLGRRYIRNAIRNLTIIPQSLPLEKLSFGSDPVLVLGAGPSLDKLLDALPARFGESLRQPETRPFRIICVDTSLPCLKERGIRPDLAVILESQHWNLGAFAGLSGWNVPTALDLSALPRSGTVLSGGIFLYFTPWTELSIFERLGAAGLLPAVLPPLGSVGLSAMVIARRVSQGTIITAGLDFSFTMDSFHARATPGHLGKLLRQNRLGGLLNTEAAFDRPAFTMVSKTGDPVLSSPALRNYRSLFEREFAGGAVPRIFDLAGSGLPLGLRTISPETAFNLLSVNGTYTHSTIPAAARADKSAAAENLRDFIRNEQDRLTLLRNILTGEAAADYQTLEVLVNECDYLWTHFPDYAAAGRRPGIAELEAGSPAVLSFLKRLRAEIDPFLKLWSIAESALRD